MSINAEQKSLPTNHQQKEPPELISEVAAPPSKTLNDPASDSAKDAAGAAKSSEGPEGSTSNNKKKFAPIQSIRRGKLKRVLAKRTFYNGDNVVVMRGQYVISRSTIQRPPAAPGPEEDHNSVSANNDATASNTATASSSSSASSSAAHPAAASSEVSPASANDKGGLKRGRDETSSSERKKRKKDKKKRKKKRHKNKDKKNKIVDTSEMTPEQMFDRIVASQAAGPPRTEDQNGITVRDPHPHDVLHGKGQHVSIHPGNLFFRAVCWTQKEAYEKCSKNEKQHVANKVIACVRDRGGRFLEPVGEVGNGTKPEAYVDARDRKVFEKTCQALREKKWKRSTKDLAVALMSGKPLTTAYAAAASSSYDDGDEAEAPAASTPQQRQHLLDDVKRGSRISVYWPLDRTYYSAIVEERKDGRTLLRYIADGVLEWITLSEHQIKVEKI